MTELIEYHQKLAEVLQARQQWLEKSELPQLKEEFRTFHDAFSSLFSLFLKRRILDEDPYKQDVKVADIEVPDTSPFPETERVAKMSIRLAQFDNQLDFLVNFYQISLDSLSVEKIKRILGLVKYIDWARLIADNHASSNTNAMVVMIAQARQGTDPLTGNVINQALADLYRATGAIMGYLKVVVDYIRETYKMDVREKITGVMQPADAAQIAQIKKRFGALMPGQPFYAELVEEVIQEDYSDDAEKLRALVLKKIAVPDASAKITKPSIPLKTVLIGGIFCLGGAGSTLAEISGKVAENADLLENRRKNFYEKLIEMLRRLLQKEPEPVVYEVEYFDSLRAVKVRENVNLNALKNTMDQKISLLQSFNNRGGGLAKFEAMEEAQILAILERNIQEVQSLHKTLSALDDFFKTVVDKEDRSKVKGIKPELGSMKTAIANANRKRHDYSAQKEEEEQLKRLGIGSRA
ncbi:MAG: hypothetical protein LBE17_12755 [Treponema sp.]|jgi:tetratricopeptide (TPR) repeat protein|nr:hypothetical protein [Treponema sp.]